MSTSPTPPTGHLDALVDPPSPSRRVFDPKVPGSTVLDGASGILQLTNEVLAEFRLHPSIRRLVECDNNAQQSPY